MPLVHVQAARRPGTPVQVLVVAPEGEVDAPPIQVMRHDADAVAAVEADHYLLPVRGLREPLHVGELAAPVVDARQQGEGDLARHRVDDVILLYDAAPRLHQDQVLLRVPAPQPQLRVEGVEVAGEVLLVGQDLRPPPPRTVEGGDQCVQVHRRSARDDHLVGLGPDQRRYHGAQPLTVVDPRDPAPAPAAYAERPPLACDPHKRLLRVPAHQPQAVPVHVYAAGDMVEPILVDGERVLGVKPQSVLLTKLVTQARTPAIRVPPQS